MTNDVRHSARFFESILDSLSEQVAVIDQNGGIVYVNAAWSRFGASNGGIGSGWRGVNYLDICRDAAGAGDKFGQSAIDGIQSVISDRLEAFYLEYPCHSPDEKRWFMMRVTRLCPGSSPSFVVSHQNITERKLAEENVEKLSYFDPLTGLANRRRFNEFLSREWRRCKRLHQSLSLVLLDIDHFKLFNDKYGHIAGDDCLKMIGNVLESFGKRATDLSARYGGEEFALILAGAGINEAKTMAEAIRLAVRDIAIPHPLSPTHPVITASLGVAMMKPETGANATSLIEAADRALYLAKANGRDQVMSMGRGLSD